MIHVQPPHASFCAPLVIALLACAPAPELGDSGEDATGSESESESGEEDQMQAGPSYWQDIAPIYHQRCLACHEDGGIGPLRLDNYADAAQWAELSVESILGGSMPPWAMLDDGSCNDWDDSRALSDAELDTILAWVDAGTPEGSPDDYDPPPEAPANTFEANFEVSTPAIVPEAGGGPLLGNDEYRCIPLELGLDKARYFTGYEVIPGRPDLVHHAMAMIVDPQRDSGDGRTNLEVIETLDAESPDRPGWSCLSPHTDLALDNIPITWAPGQQPAVLADGSGLRIEPGSMMVVQIHYTLQSAGADVDADSTTLRMRLEQQVEREGSFGVQAGLLDTLSSGQPHVIPAGEAEHVFRYSIPVQQWIDRIGAEDSIELWGLLPHMHEYGRDMSIRVLDSQGEEVDCAGEVRDFDDGWQLYYQMQAPVMLRSGDSLEVTCTYDTRDAPGPLLPGWGVGNEMCLIGTYYVVPD